MKQTLEDMNVKSDQQIPMFCYNTSAISISKNAVMHLKTKHIPIKYHFLRDQIEDKKVNLDTPSQKRN